MKTSLRLRPLWWVALLIPSGACAIHRNNRAQYAALRAELSSSAPATGDNDSADDETGPTPLDAVVSGETLDRSALVRAVLALNPTLEAARDAAVATLARAPQARALPDPMVSLGTAPLSWETDRPGMSGQIMQSFPVPGTLALRSATALAEADAAAAKYEYARVMLALTASQLYDHDHLLARALDLNQEQIALMESLRDVATARFTSGAVSMQDPLMAEVELAHLRHRRTVLEAQHRTTRAQINALLHRAPEATLPATPTALPDPGIDDVPDHETLRTRAVRDRPDLRMTEARLRASETREALAQRAFSPDFTVGASYSSMWPMASHRTMVMLGFNVPLQLGRRTAALRQSRAEHARAVADRDAQRDQAELDLYRSLVGLREQRETIGHFVDHILPADRARLQAARAGFEAGRNSFLAVIEAARQQLADELGYEDALSGFHSHRAHLQAAIGQVPGLEETPQ